MILIRQSFYLSLICFIMIARVSSLEVSANEEGNIKYILKNLIFFINVALIEKSYIDRKTQWQSVSFSIFYLYAYDETL